MSKKILITGSAGFIGFHLVKKLLSNGFNVIGIDNLNNYYDPALKTLRLNNLNDFAHCSGLNNKYSFYKLDISNGDELNDIFFREKFDIVINLAAQAGVRYSLERPESYVQSNLVGFFNILECCRNSKIKHFLFASSSSVYGMNIKQPFCVSDNTDYPVSLYAATKKSNEILAHSYSHLFSIPCTGLRFFTVYGPYGRPDMAYYSFTKAIDNGVPIDVYNNGEMQRDFTYIDDIVEGIMKLLDHQPAITSSSVSTAKAPYQILNIGNNNTITLKRFIQAIESSLGKKAMQNLLPMQPGDVPKTYANIDPLKDICDFQPNTSIENGIKKFVDWYKENKKTHG